MFGGLIHTATCRSMNPSSKSLFTTADNVRDQRRGFLYRVKYMRYQRHYTDLGWLQPITGVTGGRPLTQRLSRGKSYGVMPVNDQKMDHGEGATLHAILNPTFPIYHASNNTTLLSIHVYWNL